MTKLLVDTREQQPLDFPKMKDVEVLRHTLLVGDYTARHLIEGRELPDVAVVERKGLSDLFLSFAGGYEREKAKWVKAQHLGLQYVLAIEGTISDILQGNRYWHEGEAQESRKSGLTQLRQLCTLSVKYQVQTWFFTTRKEMALYLLEYFLASGRWLASHHVCADRRGGRAPCGVHRHAGSASGDRTVVSPV